jgi:hypothetical protein
MNLIGGDMFALDGCKLSSNASKEWSGTKAELKNKMKKIRQTMKYILNRHKSQDQNEAKAVTKPKKDDDKINRMKLKVKKIRNFLRENDDRIGKRGAAIKSNITDNESGTMKSSHGVVQGYNGLAVADSKRQVVIHAGAFGSNSEHEHLERMVESARDNMIAIGEKRKYLKGKMFLADTGYFSRDNIEYLLKLGMNAYIPDSNFRHRDPRFNTANRHKKKARKFTKDDFKFSKRKNTFICPEGRELMLATPRAEMFGVKGRKYVSRIEDCHGCKSRKVCIGRPNTKRCTFFISNDKFNGKVSLVELMKRKIDSKRGKNAYSKRMGLIEPVYANIRNAKGMNKFTLRGSKKVNIQWMLYNLVHNIGKINTYGRRKCAIA